MHTSLQMGKNVVKKRGVGLLGELQRTLLQPGSAGKMGFLEEAARDLRLEGRVRTH